MKFDVRANLIAKSSTAVLMGLTCLFGCSNEKPDESSVVIPEPTLVNAENVSAIVEQKDKTGARPNIDLFRFKADTDKIKEMMKDFTEVKETKLFDEFSIYKDEKNGKFAVVNKEEAVTLLDNNGEYSVLDDENGTLTMTTDEGERLLVFGSANALKNFSDELKKDFEEAKAKEEKPTIVNGIMVGEPVETMEVSRYDGTRTYYDFTKLMDVCIKGIEKGGYADPITYEKTDDGKGFVINRTAYYSYAGKLTGVESIDLQLPLGTKGDIYWEQTINCLIGMTFEENGKTWICADTVRDLLGIDITDGEYIVPGTDESYEALIVDTSGSDEVKVTVQPIVTEGDGDDGLVIEVPEVSEGDDSGYNIVIGGDEFGDEPVSEPDPAPSYNEDIYEKLGIKVELSGTNEEQAQQYYEACKEAYPNLDWVVTGVGVGVDVSSLRSETSIDVWDVGTEAYDNALRERLAGRDYHDLSLEELAQIVADFPGGSELSSEINRYFNDLTGRDFNAGGLVILG